MLLQQHWMAMQGLNHDPFPSGDCTGRQMTSRKHKKQHLQTWEHTLHYIIAGGMERMVFPDCPPPLRPTAFSGLGVFSGSRHWGMPRGQTLVIAAVRGCMCTHAGFEPTGIEQQRKSCAHVCKGTIVPFVRYTVRYTVTGSTPRHAACTAVAQQQHEAACRHDGDDGQVHYPAVAAAVDMS
jgi:hypothetical protein